MANTPDQSATAAATYNGQNPTQQQSQPSQYNQNSGSPAPVQYNQYASTATPSYPQTQHHASTSSSYHSAQPDSRYSQVPQPYRTTALSGATSNSVRPHEVFRLSEQANAQIPEEVRQQYQQDEYGNVLFFTAPPVDVLPPTKEGSALGHTARYLAEKLRRKIALKEKRKAEGLPEDFEEPKAKRVRPQDNQEFTSQIHEMRDKALRVLVDQMQEGTEAIYKNVYGPEWQEGARMEAARTAKRQAEAREKQAAFAESERKRKENATVPMAGTGVFLDDVDPRY
ncbi:MAG: hypothetical protein Q9222_002368 [Ikaeria aurantiellina]